MSINKLTAMIIASRHDICIDSSGPVPCSFSGPGPGKQPGYVGWITLGEADRFRPLLSSAPIHDSHEAARKAMQQIVDQIRALPADAYK